MHDDLCQATAVATASKATLHCWRPPHNKGENHWDRDFDVYWFPTPLPVREPRRPKPGPNPPRPLMAAA